MTEVRLFIGNTDLLLERPFMYLDLFCRKLLVKGKAVVVWRGYFSNKMFFNKCWFSCKLFPVPPCRSKSQTILAKIESRVLQCLQCLQCCALVINWYILHLRLRKWDLFRREIIYPSWDSNPGPQSTTCFKDPRDWSKAEHISFSIATNKSLE